MTPRIALVLSLLASGCAPFLGIEEGALRTGEEGGGDGGLGDEGGSGGDATAGGGLAGEGGMAGEGEGGTAGAGGAACDEQPFEVFAEADTVIIEGGCDGANYYGGAPYANIGIGTGLFRFPVDSALEAALAEGRVVSMSLVLSRDVACLGSGETCPAAAGTLSARPLRNDWVEGPYAYSPYQGADWCRRGAGQGSAQWNVPGATGADDAGDVSGSAAVDSTASTVSLSLDPEAHAPFVDTASGALAMSVSVIPDTTVVFVAATREDLEATELPARLVGTFCVDP